MSIIDSVNIQSQIGFQKILQAHNGENSQEYKYTTNIAKERVEMEHFKIMSLLHILTELLREEPKQFLHLMDMESDPIHQRMDSIIKSIGGRYVMDSASTVESIMVQAVAEHIYEKKELQQLCHDILKKVYPKFINAENENPLNLIELIGKKGLRGKKLSSLRKQEGGGVYIKSSELACFKYLIAWRMCSKEGKAEKNDVILSAERALIDAMSQKQYEQTIMVENEVLTSYDWLADKMNIPASQLLTSTIFNKYRNKITKKVAEWLSIQLDSVYTDSSSGEVLGPLLKEYDNDHEKYLFEVFSYEIFKLQPVMENNIFTAELFGYNQLSVVLNALAENKWYIKDNTVRKQNMEAAFNVALISVLSTNAFVCFDGDLDELGKSTLIRRSQINNPELFTTQLFFSFVLNLISLECRNKDVEYFKMLEEEDFFSIEKEQRENISVRTNDEKNTMARNLEAVSLSKKNSELEGLKEQISFLEKAEKRREDEIIAPYLEELRLCKKQNEKLREKLSKEKACSVELENLIIGYEQALSDKENTTVKEQWTDEEIKKQRLLFVGGRYELIRTLKDIFINAKFVQTETDPIPNMEKIDRIIYFSNFINHCTYNKVFSKNKQLSIPFTFINTQNYEKVLSLLKTKDT